MVKTGHRYSSDNMRSDTMNASFDAINSIPIDTFITIYCAFDSPLHLGGL